MEQTRSEFSPHHLQALIEEIHRNPALLDKDWRDVVRSHFQLSPDEEKGLVSLTPEKVRHIQEHLTKAAHHIRSGGTITGKLVKRPPDEQSDGMAYDVDVELVEKKSG